MKHVDAGEPLPTFWWSLLPSSAWHHILKHLKLQSSIFLTSVRFIKNVGILNKDYTGNVTNLMQFLSSVYWVTTLLHVSGLLVVHHPEVAMNICDNRYMLYVLVDCRWVWIQACQQSTKTYNTYQLSHIYIAASWWWATSKPKTCRGVVT
jgi:hypothetical protein